MSCNHKHTIEKDGFVTCRDCCEILSQTFVTNSCDSKDQTSHQKNHYGNRTTIAKSDISKLKGESRTFFKRMKAKESWVTNTHDAQIREYFLFLNSFKTYFTKRLPKVIEDDFFRYHEKICKLNLFYGRNRESILTAMFYLISVRLHGQSYLLEDFKHPRMEHNEFIKTIMPNVRLLQKHLNLQLQKIDYRTLLYRFGRDVGFTSNRICYAMDVFDYISKKITVRRSHIGCVLYIAGKTIIEGCIQFKTHEKVAKAIHTTEVTIRNRLNNDLIPKILGNIEYFDEEVGRKIFKKINI